MSTGKTINTKKIIFNWSGGKDSAHALYELHRIQEYEVLSLLTTVTEDFGRISMHGVRQELLVKQAKAIGYPLQIVYIDADGSQEHYEQKITEILTRYGAEGITLVGFGDIFLEDLRCYREQRLATLGMGAIFPIWKNDTRLLADSFIDLGFKAVITCVDTQKLDKTFVGRVFDRTFINELPAGVDPCGENGEFHSFVFDGPLFKNKVSFCNGEKVLRNERFYYCDLVTD